MGATTGPLLRKSAIAPTSPGQSSPVVVGLGDHPGDWPLLQHRRCLREPYCNPLERSVVMRRPILSPSQRALDDRSPVPAESAGCIDVLVRSIDAVPRLVRGCNRRLGSPLSAVDLEDAIQETQATAWEQRHHFRGDSSAETWLYGIARFRILRLARQERAHRDLQNRVLLEAEGAPEGLAVDPVIADTAVHRLVNAAVSRYGTTAANIIRYRAVDESSFGTIADRLRMKESTVKARYYKAIDGLRRLLGTKFS